jgi:hypothetical protein
MFYVKDLYKLINIFILSIQKNIIFQLHIEEEDEDEEEDEYEQILKIIKSIQKEIGEAHWAAAVLLANRKDYRAVLILLD